MIDHVNFKFFIGHRAAPSSWFLIDGDYISYGYNYWGVYLQKCGHFCRIDVSGKCCNCMHKRKGMSRERCDICQRSL